MGTSKCAPCYDTRSRIGFAYALLVVMVLAGFSQAVFAGFTGSERTTIKRLARVEFRKLAPGLQGPQGVPGNLPFLYARIAGDGGVDAARSLGVVQSNVQRTGPGIYCFRQIPAAGVQVTVDWRTTPGLKTTTEVDISPANGCSFIVFTYNSEGFFADAGFFITIY